MKNSEILKTIEKGVKESSKVLIQELIGNFEKSGTAPVISINGKVKNLKLKQLGKEEADNCKKVMKESGYKKEDFCISEENKGSSRNIIVIYKKSGKLKEYKSSQKNPWLIQLFDDLKNEFFNS